MKSHQTDCNPLQENNTIKKTLLGEFCNGAGVWGVMNLTRAYSRFFHIAPMNSTFTVMPPNKRNTKGIVTQ